MKAGSYLLAAGQSCTSLVDVLKQGQPEESFRITLPEGWTTKMMAARLAQQGIVTAANFLAAIRNPQLLSEFNISAVSASGYLFPDTYYWPKDFNAVQLVRAMLENFFNRLSSLEPDLPLAPEQLQQKVIMASIIEKEYRVAEEASLIASVFYNRLQQGQPLESCATVAYVITDELERPHPTRIFFADLELPSPYNTYLHGGLPPGPIANPGLVSLRAALFPEKSDYLFFVVKDSTKGTHIFTNRLKDHNRARTLYLANFFG